MKPNLVELRKMAAHAREHGVRMADWFVPNFDAETHRCGTAGCLVGTYIAYEKRFDLKQSNLLSIHFSTTKQALGLSESQFDWLFSEFYGLNGLYGKPLSTPRNLHLLTTEEAVRRLERFIAFHEKQEVMAEQLVHVRQIENQGHVLELAVAG